MEKQEVKPFYKEEKFLYGVLIFFSIWTLISIISSPQSSQTSQTPQSTAIEASPRAKADALKEFERLMDLSKQSGLVKSYEMDENTSLKIFVSNVWYSQEVQFKKNMLAKFSTLEQTIYGRHRLEVKDAYSNEKLAEVTAFSGSIEIYK